MATGKRINRPRRLSASWVRRRPERREDGWLARDDGTVLSLGTWASFSPHHRQLPVSHHLQAHLRLPLHPPLHLQKRMVSGDVL